MAEHQSSNRLHDMKLLFPYDGWLAKLDGIVLDASSRVKGMLAGKRKSSSLGSSLEFADYRAYIAGDDIRRIDWNLYGRTSKAYIRQYWDEQERSFQLYVDSSQSMRSFGEDEQNKWLFAMRAAASIGYLALQSEDRMGLSLFNEREVFGQLPNLYGKQAKFTLLMRLAELIRTVQQQGNTANEQQAPLTDVTDALMPFSDGSKLPRRAGVTWIFSDGLYEQGLEQLLANLQARQQQVVFVHIIHGEELEPQLEGELRLIDIETTQAKEVAMSQSIMEHYKQGVAMFIDHLRTACERRGITYYRMNCSEPLPDGFMKLLEQGEQLRYR